MTNDQQSDRAVYEAPTVVDHGDLTEITAGQGDGNFLDRTFPLNTPKDKLTFS